MPDTSLSRFFVGALFLLAVAFPLVAGARRLNRAALPIYSTTYLWLADAIVALSGLVIAAEIVGTFGQFRRAPLLVASLAVAAATYVGGRWIGSRRGEGSARREPPASPVEDSPPWLRRLAFGSAAAVAASWLTISVRAMEKGLPTGSDTWWYHLPFAARFVQTGGITGLQPLAPEPLMSFYPANGSLLHGVGILGMGDDVLSPLLNLGWLVVALLAAWSLGRALGVAPHGLIAVCVVLAAPVLRGTQAGEALIDLMVLACILASLALLMVSAGDRPTLAISGLAMGLAVGAKISAVVAAGAIAVAIPWLTALPAGESDLALRRRLACWWRRGRVPIWLLGTVLTGSYWYLRDLFRTGSPFPFVDLPFGLDSPSSPLARPPVSHSLAHDLLHGAAGYLRSGLAAGLGEAWPAVILAAVAGLVVGLRTGGRIRALAFVGLVTLVGYLLTPQTGFFFGGSLRLATVSIAVLLVVLVAGLRQADHRIAASVAAGLAAVTVVALLADVRRHYDLLSPTFVGAVAICAALAAILILSRRRPGAATAAALVAAGMAVLAGGVRWHDRGGFLSGPYSESPALYLIEGQAGLAPAFEALRDVRHARVAVYGTVLQYPLYGRSLTNYVQYVGVPSSQGDYGPITSCRQWFRQLREGRYGYVLVAPFGFQTRVRRKVLPELRWTRRNPASRLLLQSGPGIALFRLRQPPSASSCGDRGASARQ